MTVNNVPTNPKRYCVVRFFENAFWYWGSWDDFGKALEVANEIAGKVIPREEINVG